MISASRRHRLPTSPPAPHRRAPHPPTYSPRRLRPRHIRMCAPERNGLFTLSEEIETDSESESDLDSQPAFTFNLPSANASSEIFPSSRDMDFPEDVDAEEDLEELKMDIHRLSWSTAGSSRASENGDHELATPDHELEDPFSLEYSWQGMPPTENYEAINLDTRVEEDKQARTPGLSAPYAPRRPRPLDLTRYHHPFSAASIALVDSLPTPRSSARRQPSSLLPPLPILPANVSRVPPTPISPKTSTTRSSRQRDASDHVDLVSALEDLLSSCGEQRSLSIIWSSKAPTHESDSAGETPTALSFPLPPPRTPELRTPITPFPKTLPFCPASPPRPPRKDDAWRPVLQGDHSFLNSLSRAECYSPASSSGSGRSTKSLPERKALPGEWMRFGEEL